jgi:hypothetical protein
MSKFKTHTKFVEEMAIISPEIKIVGTYKRNNEKILIETEFGLCEMFPSNLLKGCKPENSSAIDKTQYFKNRLKKIQPNLEVISDYIPGHHNKINVKDKYGEYYVYCKDLINGVKPTIIKAKNPSEHFANKAKEIHGNKYDYSLVKYEGCFNKVKIICPDHGVFEQAPYSHLNGINCPQCKNSLWSYSKWENQALKSKDFDSFKVYIIKCWNENEEFYKIGKTFRNINIRFKNKTEMPYEWKLIQYYEGSGRYVCELEHDLHKQNFKFKYKPLINFNGDNECFNEINNL